MNPVNGIETKKLNFDNVLDAPFLLMNPVNGIETETTRQGLSEWESFPINESCKRD